MSQELDLAGAGCSDPACCTPRSLSRLPVLPLNSMLCWIWAGASSTELASVVMVLVGNHTSMYITRTCRATSRRCSSQICWIVHRRLTLAAKWPIATERYGERQLGINAGTAATRSESALVLYPRTVTGVSPALLRPGCRRFQRMESRLAPRARAGGQRLKRASNAHLHSMRASWWPRQKWTPEPNDILAIGLPCKIELFRMRICYRVHVGRSQHGHDPVALFQLHAGKLDVVSDETRLRELHGRRSGGILDSAVAPGSSPPRASRVVPALLRAHRPTR